MSTAIRLGWIRDSVDRRDLRYSFSPPSGNLADLPQTFDRWQGVRAPDIRDQGQTGSCVGFSTARALHFLAIAQGQASFVPSPMFLYYNARDIEGLAGVDQGCQIRDALKSSITEGVCSEDDWPFDATQVLRAPSESCYDRAESHETLAYSRVDNTSLYDLLSAIAAGPVIGGIAVYSSFMDAQDGAIPMPGDNENQEGGHALCWTAYNIAERTVTFDNSWSARWGRGGRGTLPFDYIRDGFLASDFWLLTKTE